MKLPTGSYNKLYNKQHGRCFYCAELLNYQIVEIDHIIPRSVLKTDGVYNLCLSCKSCNRLKANKSLQDFKIRMQESCPEKLIRGLFYFEFINIYSGIDG